MLRKIYTLAVCVILAASIGCGSLGDTSAPVAPASTDGERAASAESLTENAPIESVAAPPESGSGDKASAVEDATGSFHAIVSFKGEVPEPQVIQATKDAEFCSAGEGPVYDVTVKDGKLAGAVVEITVRGKDVPEFKVPKDGFVIRQKDCRFAPRLLVAYSGAELTVHNDDKVEHNVNTGEWNLLQGPGADPIRQKVNYGGNPFTRVTCNIHSWMETWVYIARSPFYAASDEKGELKIDGIPVGTKIRGTITHSTLGKQRFTVDIEAGKTTEQTFEFEAK